MSYLERRTRKDRRAKTPAQLHAWRCKLCMGKITQAEYRRNDVLRLPPANGLAFRLVHLGCSGGLPGGQIVLPRLGNYLRLESVERWVT